MPDKHCKDCFPADHAGPECNWPVSRNVGPHYRCPEHEPKVYRENCKHCARPIESDRGGPGALWFGDGFLDTDKRDWACDERPGQQGPSSYMKHEPEVFPDEVEAAIASIRGDL